MATWTDICHAALVPGTLANRAFAARKQGAAAYEKFRKYCTAKERTALDMMVKIEAAELRRLLSTPPAKRAADLLSSSQGHRRFSLQQLVEETEERLCSILRWITKAQCAGACSKLCRA